MASWCGSLAVRAGAAVFQHGYLNHLLFAPRRGFTGANPNAAGIPMKRRDFVQSSLWTAAALSIANFKPVHATAREGTVADVAAITGDGREITLRGNDLRDLDAKLHGKLLFAGDICY